MVLNDILNNFRQYTLMFRDTFVPPCMRTMSSTHTIFSLKPDIIDLNNMYLFQVIHRIFMRIKTPRDRQTDKWNS